MFFPFQKNDAVLQLPVYTPVLISFLMGRGFCDGLRSRSSSVIVAPETFPSLFSLTGQSRIPILALAVYRGCQPSAL